MTNAIETDPEQVACSVGKTLSDPIDFKWFSEKNAERKQEIWKPLSLAHGYPSALLLFSELEKHFPSDRWNKISHQYVLAIKKHIENKPISDISLFHGLAGCCFAINELPSSDCQYDQVLNTLNEYIFKHIEKTYLIEFRNLLRKGLPIRIDLYGLLHGIVGMGIYCLHMSDHPSSEFWIGEIIKTLIYFTLPTTQNGIEYPGWWVEQEDEQLNSKFEDFPYRRYYNLTMPEGITGVLAFLSITLRKGYVITGAEEAMDRICQWLSKISSLVNGQTLWGKGIPFEEESGIKEGEYLCENQGWNFGTLTVSRALFLAGTTLNNPEITKLGEESFHIFIEREGRLLKNNNASIQTGLSGTYLMTKLMARDTDSYALANQSKKLYSEVFERVSSSHKNLYSSDNYGFLDGIIGSTLTLLYRNESSWHLPLLIDGK